MLHPREVSPKLVNVFLVGYLTTTAMWLVPQDFGNPLLKQAHEFVRGLGLWQGYAIFSPPGTANTAMFAVVEFADQTKTIWKLPAVEGISIQNLRNFRYRKFGLQYLPNDRFAFLRPDFCRYVARLHQDLKRRPVSVTLIESAALIPPPAEGQRVMPMPSVNSTLCTYVVEDKDLL